MGRYRLALAAGGNAGLGVAGKSKEAAAMSAGFGAIAIIDLWRSWKLRREPEERSRKK